MERLKFALDSCVGTGRRRAFPFEHGVFAPHSKLRTARNRARRLQLARGPQARLDARADRVELDVAHEAQQVATCVRAMVEDGFRVIPAQHGVMEAARQVKAPPPRLKSSCCRSST